jgi:hypothetical protein
MNAQRVEQCAGRSRKSAAVDLAILITFFFACSLSLPWLAPMLRRGQGLGMVLAAASYQFTFEGFAPLLIMAFRHERFAGLGFARKNLGRSLAMALGLAVVYDLLLSLRAGELRWVPLRRQPAVHMSLALPLPQCVCGLAACVLAWGFFEAFFGIYLARKVNAICSHSGSGWLSPGALAFALFNGAIHLIVGQGLEGFVTSAASGYAIAVIPAVTQNSWGSALVQTLTNAAGKLRSI